MNGNIMIFGDYLEAIIELISLVFAVIIFVVTSRAERKATEDQTNKETTRATLKDFSELRRNHNYSLIKLNTFTNEEKNAVIRAYLTDLERFAVGCNMGAYDINVINRMSGGVLVSNYRKFLLSAIKNARWNLSLSSSIKSENLYIEVENMMKKLFEVRNIPFEEIGVLPEEERVLYHFLKMRISSPEDVFSVFRTLPDAIESHDDGKKGYIYIPGKRDDRCLLVAHADTFYDFEYHNKEYINSIALSDGIYRSLNQECSFGADDRAGCAILWLLRETGHSLLILDGEEHGQVGANYLKESNPKLFAEINKHTFLLQLDLRDNCAYKVYNIQVSEDFLSYIEKETEYHIVEGPGKTDIMVLCSQICGANLSIGYYDEHKSTEVLVVNDWKRTLEIVRKMLDKPLKQFEIKSNKLNVLP